MTTKTPQPVAIQRWIPVDERLPTRVHMLLTGIVAMDCAGLIGAGGRLPWRSPRDLQYFRERTLGHPVIMGRRTFASIGRPLSGRSNIVLSLKDAALCRQGGIGIAHTIAEALDLAEMECRRRRVEEAFVVGGACVYEQTLPYWDRALLTIVGGTFEGDVRFPIERFDDLDWRLTSHTVLPADDEHPFVEERLELARMSLFNTPMPQTSSSSADDWRALFGSTLHGSRNSGPGDSGA